MNHSHQPRNWLTITFVFSLLILQALGQPAFLKDGLVAYYPFNGNANDESGNRNNGIVNSATLTTNRFDYPENAFNFGNNVDSKITIQSSATIQLADSFSISIWARFNRDWTYHSEDLIGTFFGSKPNWSGWNLSVDTESSTQIGPVFVVFAAGQNGITKAAVAKVDFSDLRNWNHFVATKSNNFIFLYRNGIKIAETQLQSPVSAGRNIILGGSANPVSGANNRDVDDVRIYNRALSDGEVKALYDYESQPLPNNPRTATATAQVVNGFVVGATITSGGNGYTNNPVVTITGGGGTGAKATAFQVNGVVTSITITNPGSGYTSAPTITIAPPPFPPKKATATSQIVNGFVVGTKITDAGFGYETAPTVLLVGGGGTGATATATVQNGVVTAITITNPGTGYTSAPLIRIASPPFTPKLAIEVSKVNVRLSVVLGRKYQIESSSDLTNWKPASAVFVAQDEELVQEFDVNTTGSYYRINQVP